MNETIMMMSLVFSQIAIQLTHIYIADMSKAERNISKILEKEGLLQLSYIPGHETELFYIRVKKT